MMHASIPTQDHRLESLRRDLAGFKPRSILQLEQQVVEARKERDTIGARLTALIHENQRTPIVGITKKLASIEAEVEAASAVVWQRKSALKTARGAIAPKLTALVDRHLRDVAPELAAAVQTLEIVTNMLREAEKFGAFNGIDLASRSHLAPDPVLLHHLLMKMEAI